MVCTRTSSKSREQETDAEGNQVMIIKQLKMFLMMTAMSLMFVNRHMGTKALNKYLRRKATKSATRFHAEHI